MKIAIIIRRLNVKGGTQRQAISLAKELIAYGHGVKIYTFNYSKEHFYQDIPDNLQIVSLDSRSFRNNIFFNLTTRVPGFSYLQYLLYLIKENKDAYRLAFLIDKDIDILNPHDQVSYRVAYYFKKMRKGIPSVWTMNDMPTKTVSYLIEKELDPDFNISFWKRFLYWLIDAWEILKYIRFQDQIVVLDNRDKEWVRRYFKQNAIVVRSGLDPQKFSFHGRKAPNIQNIKLLLTGIFFPHRRFEDAILAIKSLVKEQYGITATLVGAYSTNDSYYKKILQLIKMNHLEKVIRLVGTVSDEELVKMYSTHDIFVFPSHMQSWGIAVFEAMSCGTPVVVSKTAGAAEVLTNGENALVVSPKSPLEIAAAIKQIATNQELYAKLSVSGKEFVKNNISWKKYTRNMLKIFEEVLEKSAKK